MGLRLEDAGFGKLGLWLFTFLVLIPLIVYGVTAVFYVVNAAGGGVEFNAVSVWMPQNMYGQLGVINVPLNVSSTNLLSYTNVYVVDEAGKPYYSYLFSANPPLVSILDGGMSSKTYSVFYGGTNPYSSFVAVPGQVPIYASYDDFDYDSGMWNYTGQHSISQSQLYLTNGSAVLNTSYTPGVVALWQLRAAAMAYAVVLESPYNYSGWVLVHLDSSNFADWGSVINGWDDVFFTDTNGNPLNYSIAYANVTAKIIDAYVHVNLTANTPKTIIMFYGRNNPYTQYRTPISHILTLKQTTNPTTTSQTTPKITYPTTTKHITITTNNTNITAGTVLAPHLYNWYTPLDGANYIIWDYSSEIWGANKSYALDTVIKPVSYTANNYPTFINIYKPSVIINLRFYHSSNGAIWVSAPGRIMGAGVVWGEWQRVYIEYYYSNTSIVFTSYVNGVKKSSWPASGYNYGPTRVSIGDGAHSPQEYISYVALYSPNTTVPSSLQGYIINSVRLKALLDPTFFNGTVYYDLVTNTLGVPSGVIERVPANVTWVWVVGGGASDGYVHLRFFPVGTVVRFFRGGSLVGWVVVGGVPNAVGLVEDFVAYVPPGTYNISFSVPRVDIRYSGASNASSASINGLGMYVGSPVTGCSTGSSYRTVYGGDYYCEYASTTREIGWFVPGYSPYGKDFINRSATGYVPFMEFENFGSVSNINITVFNNTGGGMYYVKFNVTSGWNTAWTWFPVELDIGPTSPVWNVTNNSSLIYFTDDAGNPLYFWVQSWNATSKEAVVWVNTTSPVFYMYAVSSGTTNPYTSYNNGYKVFDFFDDFDRATINGTNLWYVKINGPDGGSTTYDIVNGWLHLYIDNTISDDTTLTIYHNLTVTVGHVLVMRYVSKGSGAYLHYNDLGYLEAYYRYEYLPYLSTYDKRFYVGTNYVVVGSLTTTWSEGGVMKIVNGPSVTNLYINGSLVASIASSTGASQIRFDVHAIEFSSMAELDIDWVAVAPAANLSVSAALLSQQGLSYTVDRVSNTSAVDSYVATLSSISSSSGYPVIMVFSARDIGGDGYSLMNNIFEARLSLASATNATWEFLIVNTSFYPIVTVRELSNRTIVFTYKPDNYTALVGVAYSLGSWVWVAVNITANNITVIIGNGDYDAIYSSYNIYTYTPSMVPSGNGFAGVGIIIGKGGSATLNIDWLRVRTSHYIKNVNISASVQLLRFIRYVIDRPANGYKLWISGASAVDIALEGLNGSVTDIVSNAFIRPTPNGYAFTVATTSGIYNITEFKGTLSSALSGNILLVADSEHIKVWVNDTIVTSINYGIGNISRIVVNIAYIDSVIVKGYYTLNESNIDAGLIKNTYKTVSSVSGEQKVDVGWFFKYSNTTIIYGGVNISGNSVRLEIRNNSKILTYVEVAVPQSPAIIGVGYTFNNVTMTLTVSCLYVWMENNITKYVLKSVSYTFTFAVTYMVPYINSTGAIVVDKFAVTMGTPFIDWCQNVISIKVVGPVSVGGLVKYVALTRPVTIRYTGSSIEVVPHDSGSGITFEGFKGWTLNLGISGTSVSGVTITSNEYHVDVPLGFTAMIIADPSTRQISIVSASPPSQNVVATVTQGQTVTFTFATPPSMTVSPLSSFTSFTNLAILSATFIALGLAAYRLTGETGMALVVPGAVSLIIFAVLGQWAWVGVAVIALVAGLGIRAAYQ